MLKKVKIRVKLNLGKNL